MKHWLSASSEYREFSDTHHFSFLPLCGEGAIELLAETNEALVCQEFGQKSRPEIHTETLQAITEFLGRQGAL